MKYYKITFTNLNTVSLNKHFGRNCDPTEWVILPLESEEDAEISLDEFLCNTCYCDETEYNKAEELSEKQALFFANVLQTLTELEGFDEAGELFAESDRLYNANSIFYDALKTFGNN